MHNPHDEVIDYAEVFRAHIAAQEVVHFTYLKDGDPFRRTFSPWEIKDENVIGWDHDREGIRQFSFEKMTGYVTRTTLDEYVQPSE